MTEDRGQQSLAAKDGIMERWNDDSNGARRKAQGDRGQRSVMVTALQEVNSALFNEVD